MPWCCCWRSRPIGPPAPRLGGRRPRRRLCFPPPAEGCPGPAFIVFYLSPAWIAGLIATLSLAPCAHHATAIGRLYPKRLDCYRERCSNHLGVRSFIGREGPNWNVAVGNKMMLPVKWSAAQGVRTMQFCTYRYYGTQPRTGASPNRHPVLKFFAPAPMYAR